MTAKQYLQDYRRIEGKYKTAVEESMRTCFPDCRTGPAVVLRAVSARRRTGFPLTSERDSARPREKTANPPDAARRIRRRDRGNRSENLQRA